MIGGISSPYTPSTASSYSPQGPSSSDKKSDIAQGKESEKSSKEKSTPGTPASQKEFSPSEQRELRQLEARDTEVRAHEAAHMAASGGLSRGGASYTYQTGPDGKRYAIGGEVSIDASKVPNDPEATLRKSDQVRRAALAPAEPSSTDISVAAKATNMAMMARLEIQQERINPEEKNGPSTDKSKEIGVYKANDKEQADSPTLDTFA